jgi:hypothetical protein
MGIIKLQSKNIRSLALLTVINLVGIVLFVWFRKASDSLLYAGPYSTPSIDPYVAALHPLVYAGLPFLLLVSFVLGVIATSREDDSISRWQGAALTLITLVFAYIYSFMSGVAGLW